MSKCVCSCTPNSTRLLLALGTCTYVNTIVTTIYRYVGFLMQSDSPAVEAEMASSNTSQDILKDLDSILAGIQWKGPPSDLSHLEPSSLKKIGNQESVTSQRIMTRALKKVKETGGVLRVCSVGCHDGSLDQLILEGLKEYQVQYVGLDGDEQVLEGAMEKLSVVSENNNNIEVKTIVVDYDNEDMDDLQQLSLEAFDLIWMVNCTYYASSLLSLLQSFSELLKTSGEMLIVSSSKQSLEELVTRFWFHQRQHELQTTEFVLEALAQLKLPHLVEKAPVVFTLTPYTYFSDNCESPASALVLDHLVFCRLTDYPPEVKKMVMKYLKNISKMHEDKDSICITSMSDLVTVHKDS